MKPFQQHFMDFALFSFFHPRAHRERRGIREPWDHRGCLYVELPIDICIKPPTHTASLSRNCQCFNYFIYFFLSGAERRTWEPRKLRFQRRAGESLLTQLVSSWPLPGRGRCPVVYHWLMFAACHRLSAGSSRCSGLPRTGRCTGQFPVIERHCHIRKI